MIQLAGVTKRYGRRGTRPALADVSLQVPQGSVWAVVGPNGAGKSTLLGLVLGFLRPTRGVVRLDGAAPRDYLRDVGAGYLPEQFSMPGTWRVGPALRMFARLGGDPGGADRVMAQFGLEPHAGKAVQELSRGLLQRVGLAQAVLHGGPLLVLDEPTEGLDPVWRIRLRDVLAGLRGNGRTILMASHDLGEVERVADRAVLVENGAIREIIDTRPAAAPATWRIRLQQPLPRILEAFPTAEAAAVDGAAAYTVTASGPAELSERLGVLIALGGVVSAVEPVRQALEDRVRGALEEQP
jgi:ABC-2 type transport system ATP-binding protein